MSGFPQQHNNNNCGSSSLSVDHAKWTRFFDFDTAPWQKLDELLAPDIVTQIPPMLPAEATQHHQTLPQHVNQIVSAPVQLPSHVPNEALVHNGGGSMVQQNGGSSVRCKGAGRGLAWTEEEHRAFLHWLHKYGKGKWKKISNHIPTRSSTQIASHAQKYYLRQNAPLAKKKRKSIHDITLNIVSHHNDLQNSTPHPDSDIQQFHEIPQMQEVLPLNPPSNMTHQMSECGYFANQKALEKLMQYMTHQIRKFEYSNNNFGKGCYKPEYPPNNTSSSNN